MDLEDFSLPRNAIFHRIPQRNGCRGSAHLPFLVRLEPQAFGADYLTLCCAKVLSEAPKMFTGPIKVPTSVVAGDW
jgi:hypothetical protein